jgi:hypothetical protein
MLSCVRIADRHRHLRRRAVALVDEELERLRGLGPEQLRRLGSPIDRVSDEITITTRVAPEGERLMVLVEAWRGRRVLATGGFAMDPDGSARTPD